MKSSTLATLFGAAFSLVGMVWYDASQAGAAIFFIVTGALFMQRGGS
jgi:hypothetical protein